MRSGLLRMAPARVRLNDFRLAFSWLVSWKTGCLPAARLSRNSKARHLLLGEKLLEHPGGVVAEVLGGEGDEAGNRLR
jgi:hypothetical protein